MNRKMLIGFLIMAAWFTLCGGVIGWLAGNSHGYEHGKWQTLHEHWQAACGPAHETADFFNRRIEIAKATEYDHGYSDGSQNEIAWFAKYFQIVPKHHKVPTARTCKGPLPCNDFDSYDFDTRKPHTQAEWLDWYDHRRMQDQIDMQPSHLTQHEIDTITPNWEIDTIQTDSACKPGDTWHGFICTKKGEWSKK
jgi:hypothetical protein